MTAEGVGLFIVAAVVVTFTFGLILVAAEIGEKFRKGGDRGDH